MLKKLSHNQKHRAIRSSENQTDRIGMYNNNIDAAYDSVAYDLVTTRLLESSGIRKVKLKYSQLSANGHSRKRTVLLKDAFLNPRFTVPVRLYLHIPVSGHSLVSGRGHF